MSARVVRLRFRIGALAVLSILLLYWSCSAPIEPTVLLISLDGFRWDYLDRGLTPNLDRLAAEGVRAEGLTPVFPSKTFPNHYSIVTGLYPQNHGIVANIFYDPVLRADFRAGREDSVTDGRWWGGEPIWVTAEKQGRKSAPLFWPGVEAEIAGVRPSYWKKYDHDLPHQEQVDIVLSWLELPEDERPTFLTAYFWTTDTVGHRYGPDSDEISEGIRRADEAVGLILTGLEERDLLTHVNLIVVSDHGMTEVHPSRSIFLDDLVDLSRVQVDDWAPLVPLRPEASYEDECYGRLKQATEPMAVFRRQEMPERLHFRANPRIAPIMLLAEEGWTITTRSRFEENARNWGIGAHGFDNELPSMQGIFLAHGPSFKAGTTIERFENIHIYELMAHLLGVEPASNDGDFEVLEPILR